MWFCLGYKYSYDWVVKYHEPPSKFEVEVFDRLKRGD